MQKIRWILETGEDAYKAIEKRGYDLAIVEKFFEKWLYAILTSGNLIEEVSGLFPDATRATFEGVDVLLVNVSLDEVKAKLATHFELEEWKRDWSTLEWVKV